MLVSITVFVVACIGIYWLMGSMELDTTSAAKSAVLARGKRLTLSNRMIKSISGMVVGFINFDDYKRETLEHQLKLMNSHLTPEQYTAERIATAVLYSMCGLGLVPLAFIFSVWWIVPLSMLVISIAYYISGAKKMEKTIAERKELIEIELPNFANTIRQSLNTTRDVMQIFKSYRKICGKQLREEIDKTINDMYTGNTERALSDFDRRIGSAKLSELIRGLISVNRGDDQRVYFDIIAHDLQLAADEAVTRNIERNSSKLNPYTWLCSGCIVLMLIAGLGGATINQMVNMF